MGLLNYFEISKNFWQPRLVMVFVNYYFKNFFYKFFITTFLEAYINLKTFLYVYIL
jgi:hypothetical protein